ncbi:MAG: DUF3416 domain-containing protein [Actinomycetota bacterium]|nr:DUF3416 domain-containing protein [Actinomycetota bacterium]
MNDTKPTSRDPGPARPDVVIEAVEPLVDCGRFPAKAVVGDTFVVTADVFCHGHSPVRALLRHRRAGSRNWSESPMDSLGNDVFTGVLVPTVAGPLEVEVAAEIDELARWLRDAQALLGAGSSDQLDIDRCSQLVAEAAGSLARGQGAEAAQAARGLHEIAEKMRAAPSALVSAELALAGTDLWGAALFRRPINDGATAAKYRFRVVAASQRAAFSTWYELFPRSASPEERRPGTLADVTDRLAYVAELGFDVLYLPPIHPIGVTARKGRDNTSPAGPLDVGSPWAIGHAGGGHEEVAAELGTLGDFARLVTEASARGIDVAMDLAFQCSPDHPWVTEHPDWFRHRSDGTIECAENPPKRYEDIYPLDFQTRDRDGLWRALHHVTKTWADRGIRIFRVDNPHTKPFAFWEWLIAETKREYPDTVFLSEAFTRPKVMHRLAKVGFDQSYTYFTWRYAKAELTEYFEELTGSPGRAYFRPNVWPNTPDILAVSLQHGGRASFIARLVLAGGLCANYGIYGPVFELMWDKPVVEGSEEYLHSEKYEVHHHDLDDPKSLRDVIARLNLARRSHRALQRDGDLAFLEVDNDQIIAWCKQDKSSSDVVIGVVNLDPHWVQSGFVALDLTALGLGAGSSVPLRDILSDTSYVWQAGRNYVRLDPAVIPAHLLVLERP